MDVFPDGAIVVAAGTSVAVYRSKELRRYQYFCLPNWSGGLYVTPTVAGSRPGKPKARCPGPYGGDQRLGQTTQKRCQEACGLFSQERAS
jgi:hypothetical protein